MDTLYTYRVLSPGVRVCHWTLVVCMGILFATGLYIGNPGYIGTQGMEPTLAVSNFFSMSNIRFVHFVAAFVFSAALLARIYLAFTRPGNRLFMQPTATSYWSGLAEMVAYYTFLRSHHKLYIRNPLASTAYFVVYLLMLVEMISGLAMYAMIRPNSMLASIFGPFNGLVGNEYMTHIIHHYLAWFFILFAIAHVYLVFYNDATEKCGELSSMVSGEKHYKQPPVDLERLAK